MTSLTHRKTPPFVVLQNEIEILGAQIRLIELYVKQAQATEAEEADRQREGQQAEVAALRGELERKIGELQEFQTARNAADHTVNEQLQAVRAHLETTEQLLQDRQQELEAANAAVCALREGMAQRESEIRSRDGAVLEAERFRHELQSELASVRSRLDDKDAELLGFQDAAKEHEDRWNAQLQRLQARLAEQESALQRKEAELNEARGEVAEFERRNAELESAAGAARVAVGRELELTRTKFQTELDAVSARLRSKDEVLQDREAAIAVLEAENRQATAAAETARREGAGEVARLREQLQQKDRRLAELQSEIAVWQQSEEDRVHALQQQLSDKVRCLEAAQTELGKSKSEASALRERIAEAEASREEALAAATRKIEQTREAFLAEAADLQARIERKEQDLQDRETRSAETERSLRVQLQELQNRLGEKQRHVEDRERCLQEVQSRLDIEQASNRELNSAKEHWQAAVAESESRCRELQSEISNLRDRIDQKEKFLAEREEQVAAAARAVQGQIQDLQRQLVESRAGLENKTQALEHAQSETAALRGHISELQSSIRDAEAKANLRAEEAHARLEAELLQLRGALKLSEDQLQEREGAFAALEGKRQLEMDRLHLDLSEKQHWLDRGHADLEQARSDIDALRQQNAELELLRTRTEKLLTVQGEQIRERVRTEIETLETQLHDKDALLLAARRQSDELRTDFEARVDDLQCQLAEKQLLNDSRAAAINDLTSQVNRLREQNTHEEISFQRARAALDGELARVRQCHEAETAALREELRRSRADHEERAESFCSSENQLRLELSGLRTQLAEKEKVLYARESDLQTTRGELAAVRDKLASLESKERQENEDTLREAMRAEAALRAELATKDRALAEQHQSAERLEEHYRRQTDNLRDQATELRRQLDIRNAELERAKDAAEESRRRLAGLEAAADEMERREQQAQDRVGTLEAEVVLRATSLRDQEVAAKQQEDNLQREIAALRTEAREKHLLLESRNEELVRAKAELDALQDRLGELESSARRTEETAAAENDQMRAEFQAQIAYLQAELSQKDWALAERQAVRNTEPSPGPQLRERPPQGWAARRTSEKRDNDFVLGESHFQEHEQARSKSFDKLIESAQAGDRERFAASRQRRWRTGWGWKRRWKNQ